MRWLALLMIAFGTGLAQAQPVTAMLAAGREHSVALGTDGAIRTWGSDGSGQLGLGRSLAGATPIAVPGATNVIALAAGDSHSLALRSDGTVIAWGANETGQLGDGSRDNRSTAGPVSGLSGVAAISARGGYSLALRADGTVWSWGANGFGQLGIDDYADHLVPQQVPGLADVIAISAGGGHVVALKRDGTVWAWGANDDGQLGDGTKGEPFTGRATPMPVRNLANVTAISAGGRHSLARTADGSVWAWGDNDRGEIGEGGSVDVLLPLRVFGITNAVHIAAGVGHSYALTSDGTAWAWGANGYAELGDGTFTDRPTPIRLAGLEGTTSVATGFLHSLAVRGDGTIVAWGNNEYGQLGDGTTQQRLTPSPVAGINGIRAIVVGGLHTLALKNDGTIWSWGSNAAGQLGDGALVFRSTPSPLAGNGFAKIAAGGYHTIALKGDGSVLTWGDNRAGQLGDGSANNRSAPAQAIGLGAGSGVVAIAAGGIHSLALRSDGRVLSWGDDYSSALAEREISDTAIPGLVIGITNATAIAGGGSHSVALRNDGTVWIWGRNDAGQLGNGSTTIGYAGEASPAMVAGLADVVAISAGDKHTVALKRDGTVWAWGGNESGQLGDGTIERRLRPVRVEGIADVASIVAADVHTLAIKRDGTLWAWGANWGFQFGDGTSDGRVVPAPVAGVDDLVSLSANSHALARRRDGSVWAWGENGSGRLGDGTLVHRPSPIVVLRENGGGSVQGNDWFLDLDSGVPTTIPAEKLPVFLVVAAGAASDISADVRVRPQDVGTTASVYVFAMAPATVVKSSPSPLGEGRGEGVVYAKTADGKDTPVQCVLSQLTSSGQLVAVSASSLQAYITGVLSAQIQAVSIINGVPTVNIGGATFYVGYGPNAGSMLGGGTNRSVVTVPGQLQCSPQKPQTGWWWNPAEDGRGFSIEVRGNNLFFASFLYDVTGRSNWYVATGPTSLDGSLFNGDLLSARGGQALGAAYPGFPTLRNEGAISLAFNDAKSGTLVWPGGAVPIQRFNIVPNGLTLPSVPNQPESGWWWNPNEAGRGFFLEWQGGILNIAGYMYDDQGNPVWYLTQNATPTTNAQSFSSNWWSFANGMTLMGPWRPHTRINANVAPVTIQFQGSENAIMTLPNGRTTAITRHRF